MQKQNYLITVTYTSGLEIRYHKTMNGVERLVYLDTIRSANSVRNVSIVLSPFFGIRGAV